MPNDIDDYVHRIGRTGRAGKVNKKNQIVLDLPFSFKDWSLNNIY